MHRRLLWLSVVLNIVLSISIFGFVTKLGGVNYLLFKLQSKDDSTGLSVGRAGHLSILDGKKATGEIVFVGDSLTEMVQWSEALGNPRIINRGVGGDNTGRILDRIESIASNKPIKLFIMAGINDLVVDTPAVAFGRYERIIKTVKRLSPDTRIYIESTIPVNNSVRETKRRNNDVSAINDMLMRLANPDEKIEWIDVRPALVDGQGNLNSAFTFDGLHLNGDGIKRWMEVVQPKVIEEI